MSGPVEQVDVPTEPTGAVPTAPEVEIIESHSARVGRLPVRRALPRRARRSVGAWCFADHMGPLAVSPGEGADVGPHPHIGLQTVTWLLAGELLHRDSLGSEQPIRPGALNLMTAGNGVSHAEESTSGYRGDVHGIQLWVAQPEATRHGDPAFEHHAELPRFALGNGEATVLVGEVDGVASSARRDSDHVGVDLALGRGTAVVPLDPTFEVALVVAEGEVVVDGTPVVPGRLAYLGQGRDELAVTADGPARALLLGGVPLTEPLL
ncbi:MAG: pirin family protein, partial [Acidimicrobiia bacterium]